MRALVDIIALNWTVVLAFALWPLTTVRRAFPRVLPGPGVKLPELADNDAPYERRYRRRIAVPVAALLIFVFVVVRMSMNPQRPADLSEVPLGLLFGIGLCGFVLSLFAVAVARHRMETRFAADHPEFAEALTPIAQRMGPLVGLSISLAFLAVGAQFDLETGSWFFLAGILALILVRKLSMRALLKKQRLVELDSDLGRQVTSLGQRFGFTPRRIILLHSLVANGGAYPNGVIMATTGLRVILSDDQLIAILAHEISHNRDRDTKLLRLVRVAAILPMVAGVAGDIGIYALTRADAWFAIPLMASTVILIVPLSAAIVGRVSRRLEFKCDTAAKDHAYGKDLADGLIQLHRYQGLPARWVGLDRFTLTHPSLADRVYRLTGEQL